MPPLTRHATLNAPAGYETDCSRHVAVVTLQVHAGNLQHKPEVKYTTARAYLINVTRATIVKHLSSSQSHPESNTCHRSDTSLGSGSKHDATTLVASASTGSSNVCSIYYFHVSYVRSNMKPDISRKWKAFNHANITARLRNVIGN